MNPYNLYKPVLILLIFFLFACGNKDSKSLEKIISDGNLTELRAKKEELRLQQREILDQSKLIDEAISRIDTTKNYPLVTTWVAKSERFRHYLEIQGSVQTKKNILLYPEFSGILTKIHVVEGQNVQSGQLLASIDDGGLSQRLAQLEVSAALAKTTFERQQNLWDQKIGSEIQYLQAKSNYEAQEKAVEQMRAQLDKTKITAPFSGVIDDIITEQGSVIVAGQSPVLRIVNLSNMYIESEIPETYIKNITKGKEVLVYIPVLGDTIHSTVKQAGQFINPNNRSFKIEVDVPNNGGLIKPNLTAKLSINDYINERAILIPQSIISENSDGDQYVFVVDSVAGDEAKAGRRIIETGKTSGDLVEIVGGLSDGDIIVNEGARHVKDGQTVKILRTEENGI